MDNFNSVEDIPSERTNYANELSAYVHDVTSMSRSLLLELVGKKSVRTVEQRVHERFKVIKDAFALIRPAVVGQLSVENKSMAEIACAVYRSKSIRFGRIDNISLGGLSFRYIASEEHSNQSLVLDILVAESGFYLENLLFKDISDVKIDDDFVINSFKMRLNRVQFEGMKPNATIKLKHFIENYSL